MNRPSCPNPESGALGAYDAVDLVVWSGTGNVRRVAERFAAAARAQGAIAEVRSGAETVARRRPGRRLLGPARRPYWTLACHNCMRCMSRCPEDAIQGPQAWLAFYVWAAGLPGARRSPTRRRQEHALDSPG